MATTAVNVRTLAAVRQLEALGSRAWVAQETIYDRTWACRLTPDYPSWRLNSVTPLDPADADDTAARMTRLCMHTGAHIMPVRATPLLPAAVTRYCQQHNWHLSRPVAVLTLAMASCSGVAAVVPETVPDGEYATVSLLNRGADPALHKALLAIIQRSKAQTLPFVLRVNGEVIANMLVVHDGAFAGILDFTVIPGCRRQGFGRSFMAAVLQILKSTQVRTVWVHSAADNDGALQLYKSCGFVHRYDYAYWSPR